MFPNSITKKFYVPHRTAWGPCSGASPLLPFKKIGNSKNFRSQWDIFAHEFHRGSQLRSQSSHDGCRQLPAPRQYTPSKIYSAPVNFPLFLAECDFTMSCSSGVEKRPGLSSEIENLEHRFFLVVTATMRLTLTTSSRYSTRNLQIHCKCPETHIQ